MLTLSPASKLNFFDRPSVLRAVEGNRRRFLSKAGAYVRQRARTSIRRRKYGTIAKPGSPPFAHSTDPYATLKNILFAYDPQSKSVVVGPVGLNGGRSKVPGLMEFGGVSFSTGKTVWAKPKPGLKAMWRKPLTTGPRKGLVPTRITGPLRYKGNPFMAPALAAEAPFFPSHWQSAVTNS
jgi:hypothetical protein